MRFRNKIFIGLFFATLILSAQDAIYTIVKVMPEFDGGTGALAKYISLNVQYPPEARENNYSGKSYVNFIVDTTGQILSPTIIKSSGHKCLDEEAIRVIKSMPKWVPGSDSLKKVKVSINLPIGFKNLDRLSAPSNEVKLSPEEQAQQAKHDKAMEYYYDGHKLEQKERYAEALEKFDLSLNQEPQNKFSLFDKAKMHMKLGQKAKACEIWTNMSALNLRKEEAEAFIKKYCN